MNTQSAGVAGNEIKLAQMQHNLFLFTLSG